MPILILTASLGIASSEAGRLYLIGNAFLVYLFHCLVAYRLTSACQSVPSPSRTAR